MKKVALIVGHDLQAQGAISCGYTTEYGYNKELVAKVCALLDRTRINPIIVYREHGYGRLPGEVNETRADLAVEFHFNAANGHGSGTEVLHWYQSAKGRAAAIILQDRLVAALNLPNRGIKPCKGNDRGGLLLMKTVMPCLIAEPFFGDNHLDWDRAIQRGKELVNAYVLAIEEICEKVV
jgi:N-acetylmuramoyl-L-alanine amidase